MQERRIDADLEDGRSAELVAELEPLIAQHPLRERLRGQLMLALYRSGRQADALSAYQQARSTLVDELGIEPGPALQELERAMLRQDPSLDLARERLPRRSARSSSQYGGGRASTPWSRSASRSRRPGPPRELILARLTSASEMTAAAALLNDRRELLTSRGVAARTAAFTSTDPGGDLVRLASEQDSDLLLVDCRIDEAALDDDLGVVLEKAPCDVALLAARDAASPAPGADRPVVVPFGGAEHDWAAVEVAAWIAHACGASLRLAGAEGDPGSDKRDASRLLASAALLVQRAAGVATEPLLVPRGHEGVVRAAADAGLVVTGLSGKWRDEGLGETRLAIARHAGCPTLFVRRGLRPGGLAPGESLTRFTWSLPASSVAPARLSPLSSHSAASQRRRRPCRPWHAGSPHSERWRPRRPSRRSGSPGRSRRRRANSTAVTAQARRVAVDFFRSQNERRYADTVLGCSPAASSARTRSATGGHARR